MTEFVAPNPPDRFPAVRGMFRLAWRLRAALNEAQPRDVAEIVPILRKILPGGRSFPESLLSDLAATVVIPRAEGWGDVAHRLAAMAPALRERWKVVPAWTITPPEGEWVLAEVRTLVPTVRDDGRKGVTIRFRVLTGPAATRSFREWWSMRRVVASIRSFGFDRPAGRASRSVRPLVWRDATDFVQLKIVLWLAPGPVLRSGGLSAGYPEFKTLNRRILGLRFRVLGTCPIGHPDDFPCRDCHRGYDTCAAAVKPKTISLPRV